MGLILSLDYETSSPQDLTEIGAYRYAKTASIMCAAYALYEENKFDPKQVRPWRAWTGEEMPADLCDALRDPAIRKFAWNAQFERLITRHATKVKVPLEQWYCTAARARASAYPGKLDLCAKALAIPQQKDLAGGKLMKRLSVDGVGTPEEYERVMQYCMQDVVVEATIGMVVRDLTAEEWQDYWVCERMNDRGIPVDVELARAAQRYATAEAAAIAKELEEVTAGAVTSAKQFKRIKEWLKERAPELMELLQDEDGKVSLDKSGRTAAFESDLNLSPEVEELLHLIDDAGRASTAKYAAIEARTDEDERLRGAYLFNGAGQTGRFSAVGFQPHNLVRDKLDNAPGVIDAVLMGAPAKKVEELSNQNILTTLARMLRPTIIAEEGNVLVWADYSAIEARALPWLSDNVSANDLLELFRRNEDVYKYAAADIYRVPVDQVDKAQRQMGKIAVLALGYQGGKNAFRKMARAYGLKIDDATAEEIKVAWRHANPWAKKFWADLEGAAIRAVRHPGAVQEAGRIKYLMHGDMLYALLPCGRLIAYPEAQLLTVEGKFGPQTRLTALKASMHPKKGEKQWPRVALYGGLLAENATQGFCASLLRAAVRRLDEAGWPVVMHTHDEVLLEIKEDELEDGKQAITEAMLAPFSTLPLAVDVQHGYSYDK
jgi:DNA polymerase